MRIAIVEEARRAGVPVTAHLRDTSAVAALEAGVSGLEHALGFEACDEGAGDAVARLLVSRNAYVVPTLAITSASGSRLPCLKRFIGRLAQAGGRVLAGTDTANSRPAAGALLHRELELLVESGLSPQAALTAATGAAASALGQGESLGRIEPGRIADLVVVAADPSGPSRGSSRSISWSATAGWCGRGNRRRRALTGDMSRRDRRAD